MENIICRFMLAFLTSAAAFTLSAQKAEAEFTSGNQLYEYCSTNDQTNFGFCFGYIEGIADALVHVKVGEVQACLPMDVIGKQVKDVVVHYLYAHPEQRSWAAPWLVAHALYQAFPCN